ncbi:hypothetical protein GCM10020331_054480 [Ectobacillus funiculus]
MGIIGALDSGMRGNHDVLYTKAIIDAVLAAILTTTLGIGVLFSAIPVILYEGSIAIFLQLKLILFIPPGFNESFYWRNHSYWRNYDYCYRFKFNRDYQNKSS